MFIPSPEVLEQINTKKVKQHIKKKLAIEKCPNCQINSVEAIVYTGYYHLGDIPILAMGKEAAIKCSSCNHTLHESKLSVNAQKELAIEKKQLKRPLWYSSGIITINVLLVFVLFKQFFDQNNYINNPTINDTYSYIKENGNYSLFKIKTVTHSSLGVIYNNKETHSKKDVLDLDDSIQYNNNALYPISKSTIKKMLQDKKILGIHRPS